MTLIDPAFGLRALIGGSSTVTAIAGSRIFPEQIPQGEAAPCVVYSRISESEGYTYVSPSGLVAARFQIDAWAKTVDMATALALAVKDQIGGFRGVVVYGEDSPPEGALEILGVFLANGRGAYDDATKLFGVSRDFFIWYQDG